MSQKEENFFARHLEDLPDNYVECRDLRHTWRTMRRYRPVEGAKSKTLVARVVKCERCEAERTDVLDVRTFDRVSSSYHYPEGYTIVGNKAKNRAKHVRREVYNRFRDVEAS